MDKISASVNLNPGPYIAINKGMEKHFRLIILSLFLIMAMVYSTQQSGMNRADALTEIESIDSINAINAGQDLSIENIDNLFEKN